MNGLRSGRFLAYGMVLLWMVATLIGCDVAPSTQGGSLAHPLPEKHVHTEVIDPAIVPSCTESGKTEGIHCVECGTVLVDQQTIPASGHDEIALPDTATCVADGMGGGTYCTQCKQTIQQPVVCPKTRKHEYQNDRCLHCGEHEPTAGVSVIRAYYDGYDRDRPYYYINGMSDGYSCNDVLYLPSSYYDAQCGEWVEIIGVAPNAFAAYSNITEVYLSATIRIVGAGAFYNTSPTKFHLNRGLEIVEDGALGYVDTDVIIPDSVKKMGNYVAIQGNSYYNHPELPMPKLIFEGNAPAEIAPHAFSGFLVLREDAASGWCEDGENLGHGVVYRKSYVVPSYKDSGEGQVAVCFEAAYQTALRAFPDPNAWDWSLLRVTDQEKKYENIHSLAEQITASCTTDAQRIEAIFCWITDHFTYDVDVKDQDMYDALVAGRGVCAHYCNTMVQMLRSLDIPALLLNGFLWEKESLPESIDQLDAHAVEAVGDHSWLIAYNGEEWLTYDPTNRYRGKDQNDFPYVLYPIDMEGLAIHGEGYYPYLFAPGGALYCEDGRWYAKTEIGYDLRLDGYGQNRYMSQSGYNQATTVRCYYQIQYDDNGNLIHGLLADPSDGGAYTYRLCNGRLLTHVSVTIGGYLYTFDATGRCISPVPLSGS